MRLLLSCLISVATLLPFQVHSQGARNQFKEATIIYKDESRKRVWINSNQLLVKGQLSFRDSANRISSLKGIHSVQIDSTVYVLKSIRNRKDSVAILITAIGGKVSLYTPPLESGLAALYVEKDGASYELMQKIVEKDGKKFRRNEYRQFLQTFFADCPAITKRMVDKVPYAETPIMQIVSQYNKACGYENENRKQAYKAKFHYGLTLEGIYYNSRKGAYLNYFEGDRPATGFGLGFYGRLDFARRKTAFLLTELNYDMISGGGQITYWVNVPVYKIITEDHDFDIKELRNTYTINFNLTRSENFSLSAGGGILFQYQLSNQSTVYDFETKTTKLSATSSDKFGLSPILNLRADMGRIGFGYQLVLMATQLKNVEGQHLEHKLFIQTRLSK